MFQRVVIFAAGVVTGVITKNAVKTKELLTQVIASGVEYVGKRLTPAIKTAGERMEAFGEEKLGKAIKLFRRSNRVP